jgi:hypothetical protein
VEVALVLEGMFSPQEYTSYIQMMEFGGALVPWAMIV